MKIEGSCAIAADAKKVQGGLRRIPYLLFLVTAVASADSNAHAKADSYAEATSHSSSSPVTREADGMVDSQCGGLSRP